MKHGHAHNDGLGEEVVVEKEMTVETFGGEKKKSENSVFLQKKKNKKA